MPATQPQRRPIGPNRMIGRGLLEGANERPSPQIAPLLLQTSRNCANLKIPVCLIGAGSTSAHGLLSMVAKSARPPLAGLIVACFFAILLGAGSVHLAGAHLLSDVRLIDAERILEPLQADASNSPVVVSLAPSTAALELGEPDALGNAESRALWREEVAAERDWVLAQLGDAGISLTRRFHYQVGFAAEVSMDGLERLLEHPSVLSIEPDRPLSRREASDAPRPIASPS